MNVAVSTDTPDGEEADMTRVIGRAVPRAYRGDGENDVLGWLERR
jgi:hypothetical protein